MNSIKNANLSAKSNELITLKNVITGTNKIPEFLAIKNTNTSVCIFMLDDHLNNNKFRHSYTINTLLQIKSIVLKNNILVVLYEQNFINSYILDKTSFFEINKTNFIEGNCFDLNSQGILAVCNFDDMSIRFYKLSQNNKLWIEIFYSICTFAGNHKEYSIKFAVNTNRLFLKAGQNKVYVYLFDFDFCLDSKNNLNSISKQSASKYESENYYLLNRAQMEFIKTDKIVFYEHLNFVCFISNVYNHEAMSPSILYTNYLERHINFMTNNVVKTYLVPKPNIYLIEFSENDKFICFANKEKENSSEVYIYTSFPSFKFIYKFSRNTYFRDVFFWKDLFLIAVGEKENNIVFCNLKFFAFNSNINVLPETLTIKSKKNSFNKHNTEFFDVTEKSETVTKQLSFNSSILNLNANMNKLLKASDSSGTQFDPEFIYLQ